MDAAGPLGNSGSLLQSHFFARRESMLVTGPRRLQVAPQQNKRVVLPTRLICGCRYVLKNENRIGV